jgi:N-acetylneuraminic acid mutarotase
MFASSQVLRPRVLLTAGLIAVTFTAVSLAAPQPTTTTLAMTSGGMPVTTVASGSVVTLTATVMAGTAAVMPGQVNFCDASAAYCTDIHLLGTAQLTKAGTAFIRFRPGMGSHNYKAVFLGITGGAQSSTSGTAALTVTGLNIASTAITESGSAGNYTLTATVGGNGSMAPTGTVNFLDASNGNALLGTATLGTGTAGLSTLVTWSPFDPLCCSYNMLYDNFNIGIAVGDFNGDGIPDLVVANYGNSVSINNTLTVLLGNGDGTFTALAASPKTGGAPFSIVVGDFNGDGIPDLAVACLDGSVTILLGNGDGTFTAAPSLKTGNYPLSITAADFNGDGNLDLAVANYNDNTVSIFLGNGDGTFTATAVSPATGLNPMGIVAGDFNGDGIPDLAVANSAGNISEGTLSVLLGNGDGTFRTPEPSMAIGGALCIAMGDFNRDGYEDLVVGNTVLLGKGDGTFTVAGSLAISGFAQAIAVGDFNGDGIPDLTVANANGNTVSILQGKGDGSFTVAATGTTGSYPQTIAVGDLNGDGVPDLAVTSESVNTVLLVKTQTATATATSVAVLPLGSGTHQVVASYSGDGNYTPGTTGATSLSAAQGTPTVNFTASENPATVGDSVTFTATVSGGGLTPTAAVNFYDDGYRLCTAILNGGVGSCAANAFTVGANSITAQYIGDSNYIAAVSAPYSLTVSSPGTNGNPSLSTTTTLAMTSSGAPVASGGTVTSGSVVTLTATVMAGATAVTPGQVNFCDASAAYCTDIHLLGTAQLTKAGTAFIRLSPGVGSHSYKAVFLGITDGARSSASSPAALTVSGLNIASTVITQSGGAGSYTLTATVGGNGSIAPTGTVNFLDASNGNAVLGTATLGAGTAGLSSLISWNPGNPLAPDIALSNDNFNVGIAVGDFNGDGIPDLVVANYGNNASISNTLTVLLGNGDGTFTVLAASPKTGNGPVAIAVGDFNGDGILDLAVACIDGSITILLGNGDGTFTPAPSLKAGGSINGPAGSIAAADFNGDGKMDLAVTDYNDNTVSIFLGNGDGTFTTAVSLATGSEPMGIVAGDFNGDGIPDLAVANSYDSLFEGTVTIFLGNGDGTFTAAAIPIAVSDATCIAVGDFNRDGIADLAVGNNVLLGNGDGTFTIAAVPSSGWPETFAVGDFNGDGIPDLAAAFWNTGGVMIGQGKGDGSFTWPASAIITADYRTVVAGDFNGDGIADLALAGQPGSTVLLSEAQTAMTTATSVAVPAGSGTHQVVASYSGDSNYKPGASGATGLSAAQGTPAVSVTASANPATYGVSVTFTATVSGSGMTPTGTVNIYDGSNLLCTATLSGGVALCATNALTAGSNSITVQYSGDSNYASATSVAFNLTVSAATPTFNVPDGAYATAQTVMIFDATPSATIYYTTDGTLPTTSSTVYGGTITVSSLETIKAIATASGYSTSAVATAGYFITPLAAGGANTWTWMSGSSTGQQPGVYGTLGMPATGNVPGGRFYANGWTDSSGHLWLFGGQIGDASGNLDNLNDLWEFNPSTNEWTWMGGSSTAGSNCTQVNGSTYCGRPGVYGAPGDFAAGNVPGSHYSSSTWTDNSGNLWLFGGCGFDSNGDFGCLNDLWEFNPTANQWAWRGGSNTNHTTGIYGTLGTPAVLNIPGGRVYASSWNDGHGHFWLFGGRGGNDLNDLWEFDPSTDEWAWMSGSNTNGSNCTQITNLTICGQAGVYGTLGTPAAGNVPGGREDATSWTDGNGNLWLFGGNGFDAGGNYGSLNDFWEFTPSINQWTWMGGSSTAGSNCTQSSKQNFCGRSGVYGALGAPAAGNIPGGRMDALSWTDSNGNLWLFGGMGFDASGSWGALNDLWEFTPSINQWAWMGGSSTAGSDCIQGISPLICGQPGVYGTLETPAAGNIPGGRSYATNWTDSSGNFWLFGGMAFDASGAFPELNDLWFYQPSTASLPTTATPTFGVAAGTYTAAQTVKISDTTDGATIYYTTDGSTPTTRSSVYSASITVSSTETIKAIATASGCFTSAVATAAFTINLPQADTPTFNVAPGTYTAPQTVTINDATAGATIYYTTDGTTPTISSSAYSTSITVSASETLEAIATASGYTQSAVASAGYFITPLAVGGTFDWTWMGGSSTVPITSNGSGGGPGVYGTLGTPAVGNVPGGRFNAASWTDSSGNLWLFGGTGYDVNGNWGTLNDLWEFNPQTNQWTWIGGSSVYGQPGVYGTLGTPAAGNIPGYRQGAASWTDSSGNLWLFGGTPGTATSFLNDLWEFNPSTNQWAWMGGGNGSTMQCANNGYGLSVCGQPGVYGTLGVPAAGNVPRGRQWATSWTDSSGNLWLFGGWGMAANGNWSALNDLWEFNPSTNQWAWMGGSSTDAGNCFITDMPTPNGSVCGQSGVYGALGTPATGNVPGGRYGITSWRDNNGNLWLFGGGGFDANGNFGNLNDLWEFNPTTNQWAWVGGSGVTIGSGWPGVYGTLGTPAAGNVPGGRFTAVSWADNSGNFWLFGGYGADANGSGGYLDDLWEFDPSTNQWAWMGGSISADSNCIQANGDTLCGQSGVFGSLGTPAAGNIPGGREYCTANWTDSNGNFWLFGGWNYDAIGNLGYLNDLWKYKPATALPATATPTFSVAAGTYTAVQSVTISDTTTNATIYYTTDGTTPKKSSTAYSGPIPVSSTETIKAIAAAGGYSTSVVATAAYTINLPQADTPTFNVAPGTYTAPQTVTINDATAGATIYYTTDGTTPTINSSAYSTSITVSASETIEAIAVASGYTQSAVASAGYTINLPQVSTPNISAAAGTYTAAQTVILTDATPAATIYYTTDGTTPTTTSSVYSGPIVVSTTETLEAMAMASGYAQSAVATAAYTVNISTNPVPVISSISPASASAGSATFTLTLNGLEFTTNSTAYWGTSALNTTYVNATQLTAQVTANEIATAGITSVTVQTPTPGGGTSNIFQFEVDSTSGTTSGTIFTSTTATVTSGSPATYPATPPASMSSPTITCLNLPPGATCSYSAATNMVTITTSPTTPAGTYLVTVVFSGTVSGAGSWILLPLLLLPMVYMRKKLAARGVWITACLGMILLAAAVFNVIGCGGGSTSTPPQTHQATSSGVVTITIH